MTRPRDPALDRAEALVRDGGLSIRAAADRAGVSYVSLYCRFRRAGGLESVVWRDPARPGPTRSPAIDRAVARVVEGRETTKAAAAAEGVKLESLRVRLSRHGLTPRGAKPKREPRPKSALDRAVDLVDLGAPLAEAAGRAGVSEDSLYSRIRRDAKRDRRRAAAQEQRA